MDFRSINFKKRVIVALPLLFLISFQSSWADTAATDSPEIAELKKQVELEKQKNSIQADLLASQKALIDAQKAAADSQTQLVTSQKTMLDALFPQVTGGKSGTITFDATTNVGTLAQPGAIDGLNKIATKLCEKVSPAVGSSVVLLADNDLKLVAQARTISMQLNSLKEAYSTAKPAATTKLGTNSLPAGVALYGVGAALKEIASFTQLFRSDSTIYSASVTVGQESLNQALAGCLLATNRHVYLPKGLLMASLSMPTTSPIQDALKNLAELRINSDAELNSLNGKSDATSKARIAKLTALNSSMDTLVSSLFSTSEKSPEPMLIGLLAGEAIYIKVSDGARLFKPTLVNAAAAGVKRSSIWFSDRLYSWASVTVEYVVLNGNGEVFAAGAVNESPEARKIEISR